MKKYRRIENKGEYKHITTVDESGKYVQIVKWNDGIVTSHTEGNVFDFGWKSLREFFRERPGFVEVDA